jgi:hypothetical protein
MANRRLRSRLLDIPDVQEILSKPEFLMAMKQDVLYNFTQ